ncbi:hypothetical protein [Aestuariivirga litoralis]|uniref:hypothetical protein n=1 Tax=Aestuariivirga litoralis TaxID=2650924 RepID=UPI0018C52C2B|nr:hypothetical protein [Aestuariivirga litoralis]MBG1233965.1 hypothetical protein [Aestuariivirga litoralis]
MKKHLKLWHAVSLLTILSITTAGAYVGLKPGHVKDAQDCVSDVPLASSTVMIVDATDPLTPLHRERLDSEAKGMLRDSQPGDKLVILAIHPEDAPSEQFARCNPGAEGGFSDNVRKVAKHYKEAFVDPLVDAVNVLASETDAPRSPIMEAITAATQRPDFDGTIARRKLIIASDMLQNTPGDYSQYSKGDMTKNFLASSLAKGDQADLKGVEVVVDYFTRKNVRLLQDDKHRDFWRKWFVNRGARSVTFVGVGGGSS